MVRCNRESMVRCNRESTVRCVSVVWPDIQQVLRNTESLEVLPT